MTALLPAVVVVVVVVVCLLCNENVAGVIFV